MTIFYLDLFVLGGRRDILHQKKPILSIFDNQ